MDSVATAMKDALKGRHIGSVKFKCKRGYGFIVQEDGTDMFFHCNNVEDNKYEDINDGDTVSYRIKENNRGKYAANVVLMKD